MIHVGTLTDSSPLAWIHVQVSFIVNDLHTFRHSGKLGVLSVLDKHFVEVFAVDAFELVFGRETKIAGI